MSYANTLRTRGGTGAILVVRVLYPDVTPEEAAEIVLPHHEQQASTDGALGQRV
jgi:(2Fe-2S) ferredoxin